MGEKGKVVDGGKGGCVFDLQCAFSDDLASVVCVLQVPFDVIMHCIASRGVWRFCVWVFLLILAEREGLRL